MYDPTNPYAAPQSDLASPGAVWVAHESPELRRVGLGLLLVYAGICLLVLALILTILVGYLTTGIRPIGGNGVTKSLLILSLLLAAVGSILNVVGPILCLGVPAESESKPWIIGSVTLLLLSIALQFVGIAAGTSSRFDVLFGAVTFVLLSVLAAFLSTFLFMVFLARLSKFIGRTDCEKRAVVVRVASIVIAALFLLTAILQMPFVPGPLLPIRSWTPLIGVGLGLGVLIVFIRYANLVNELRKALRP